MLAQVRSVSDCQSQASELASSAAICPNVLTDMTLHIFIIILESNLPAKLQPCAEPHWSNGKCAVSDRSKIYGPILYGPDATESRKYKDKRSSGYNI